MTRSVTVATLLLASLLLAGCTFSQPLSEEAATTRTQSAVASLQASLGDGPQEVEGVMADLRKISGTMVMEAGAEAGGMGVAGSGTFTVEWGQGDVWALEMQMGQGGFQMQVAIYCTPDRQVMVFGEAYEQRPQEDCLAATGDDMATLEGGLEGMAGLEGVEVESVTVDGQEVDAVMVGPDGHRVTAHLDAAGRLTRMEADSPEARVTMELEYGALRQIDVPNADARVPTSAYWSGSRDGDAYSATVYAGSDGAAPLDEIQVRIVEASGDGHEGPGDGATLATLTAADGSGEEGGWSLSYEDADGDGFLSDLDTFSAVAAEDAPEDWHVLLWDIWADAEAGSNPIPGVTPILVLSLLAGVVYWRRR